MVKKLKKEIRSALLEAADILEERGIVKGSLIEHSTGRCCALGAIGLAVGYEPMDMVEETLQENPAVVYLDQFLINVEGEDTTVYSDSAVSMHSDTVIAAEDVARKLREAALAA